MSSSKGTDLLISDDILNNIFEKVKEFPNNDTLGQDYQILIRSIEKTKNILSGNLDFFNKSEIFSNDFKKSIYQIDLSLNCFLKSLKLIDNAKENKLILEQIHKDFHLFSQLLLIFINNFINIYKNYQEQNNPNKLIQLGIESVLFNLTINIKSYDQKPFYKSNFLQIYGCYDIITNLNDKMAAFKSIYGSGKTLCFPLIIISKILERNVDSPFLIMTEPTQKIVDSKTAFFKEKIGHYLAIANDLNELIEFYNNDKKKKELVFAILTPKNILFLFQKIRKIFTKTRIIIDDANEESLYADVMMSMIKSSKNELEMPMNISVLSSIIDKNHSYINFFDNEIGVTELVEKTFFEVETKTFKSSKLPDFVNEVIKVIGEMSRINSSIEEGNVVCFLPANDACKTLINSISSFFNQSEETEKTRKVVIMKTQLKPNETPTNYFNRLRNELELINGLIKVEENKNEILFFVLIDLSEEFERSIYDIAQNDFPDDLCRINKIICSLPLNDPFTTNKLSVVIDSGLSKVTKFNPNNGLTSIDLIESPPSSISKIRGLLGRTMKGLYITPEKNSNSNSNDELRSIDLTKKILYLKKIKINIEKLNLPKKINKNDFDYAIKKLIRINALDEDLKITNFGEEVIQLQSFKNSVLSVHFASAVLNYKEKFNKKRKESAFFFGFYLATLISMATDLIQENMTERLSTVFNEGSDIVTLIDSTKILLSSDLTDNDQLRDFVESYGFSYSSFLVFRSLLEEAFEYIFQSKEISVSKKIDLFIINFISEKEGNNLSLMIDEFIEQISLLDETWKKLHTIEYKYVKNTFEIASRPTLIFSGDQKLIEWNQQKKKNCSEVRVTKRPGWNGIQIPTKCYFLNICIYLNHHLIYANIIHRLNDKAKGEIVSIELPKCAISQWFNVLIETYFLQEKLNVKVFTYAVYENNEKIIKSHLFYISNTGERVFLSFIPLDERTKSKIQHGINQCLKLMPFVPKSILIYRSGPRALIEVTSIGTQNYDSYLSSSVYGDILKRPYIDYCLSHLDELALSQPPIRICALFFNIECTINDYNQKRLYFVSNEQNEHFKDLPNIFHLIQKHRKPRKVVQEMNERRNIIIMNKNRKGEHLGYFTFPSNFIHPALLLHQETHKCIMKWFSQCKYAKVKLTVGQRFLMTLKDIRELQKHIKKDKEKILKEMGLNYVAIPIPSHVYEKAYLTIREHQTWFYDSRFKVVITTTKESNEVNELVRNITESNEDHENKDTLACCYICDDPDNPTLTHVPITLYYRDGKTYTTKMCRDCLCLNLQETTASFYNNGKINQESLELIQTRPRPIPTIDCKEFNEGMECWPQIPLGQLISVLINNDDELAGLVSAWLNAVQEFTIRNLSKGKFTFCPDHPKIIFRIKDLFDSEQIKCDVKSCKNVFCGWCLGWHPADFVCEEKKSGKKIVWQKKCPKCGVLTCKNGGCNRILCTQCKCNWCYVCGKGFNTANECYAHMKKIHGDSYNDI